MLPRQGPIRRPDHLLLSVGDHLQHAVWIDDGEHDLQGREGGSQALDPSRQNSDIPCGRLSSDPPPVALRAIGDGARLLRVAWTIGPRIRGDHNVEIGSLCPIRTRPGVYWRLSP